MNMLNKIHRDLVSEKDSVIRERLMVVESSCLGSLREVASRFGMSHGKVAYWRKRYISSGIHGLATKPRDGRPKKINKKQANKIKVKVQKHNIKRGWRTQHIRSVIYEETGVKYCRRQVIRIAQSWGLSQIKPRSRYAYSKKEDREEFIKKTNNS